MKSIVINQKIFLFICSVVITALGFTGPANALDRKINSGTVCQPNSGSQVGDFNYYSTGITNSSTASRWVSCPVVRDNTFNTNGVNFAGVYVVGAGTHSCYLDNVNTNGTLGKWIYGSRSGTGYIPLNLASSISQTPYVFLCGIPANGRLISTVVDEN